MAKSGAPRGERSVRIGPYEVVKRIGAGGMGTVYLAKDTDLGRMVALKVLPPELASKTEMIDRFRQEAQHAAKLRHENIVTLYGCGEHKGMHYLAMEFVEGCNLHEYIDKKGKLSPEEARFFILQATKALVAAHEHSIVHRDIKPSNFLLAVSDGKAVVKLTDFGLARTVDDFDGRITRSGTTVGTVDYISPEQARNSRAADIRSDIYSLGCTFYHMLAGRPPFPDGDLTERLLKHVEAEPPDLLKFNPQIPTGLIQIVKKMLAKRQEDRYQTPDDLLKELQNPPKGPAISARAALELLAEASGEKARPSSRPSSLQETRRQIKEVTAPLSATLPPTGAELKLHYRKKKNERRKRPEKSDLDEDLIKPPFVLEGLGPWLAVIGGVSVVALIGMAIVFKWGSKPDTTKRDDPQGVAKTGEPTPEKHDIKEQSKKIVSDLKEKLKKGREGEDIAASREALEGTQSRGEMPQIEAPGEKTQTEMNNLFAKGPRNSSAKNLEEITRSNTGGEPPSHSSGQPPTNPNTGSPPATGGRQDGAPPAPPPGDRPSGGTKGPPSNNGPGKNPNSEPSKGANSPPPADGKPGASTGAERPATKPPNGDAPPTPAPPPMGNRQAPDNKGTPPGVPATSKPEPRTVQVRRGPVGNGPGSFGTIAQAITASRSFGAPGVIEIKDNGPFFESGLEVSNLSLVLRGAEGFRPLIALGRSGSAADSQFLLAVQKGSLVLENIDLVFKAPDGQTEGEAGLIKLGEGNLLLEDCSLSLAGRARAGLTAIRLDGVSSGSGLSRLWLRRCFFRGSDMAALDLRGPGCMVTADGCLIVGHDRPLLSIRGQSATKLTEIKIAHSTLVGGQTLCQVDAAGAREADASIQFVLWDSLLARSGAAEGGEMLKLGPDVPVANIRWRAVNCLYTGWQSLLQYSGGTVPSADLAAWHSLLHQAGGDKALGLSWPSYLPPETERIPAALFRAIGTAAAFRDSTGNGVVGCPVQDLPAVRIAWPTATYDRAAAPALDARTPDRAPEIPTANDGRYHGGRVDVARTDLGEHLQQLQNTGQLAGRVVIHLTGRGLAQVTPFRLKDVQLVLYAESSGPVLGPKPGATADALISVENGGCELIGVHFGLPSGDKGAELGAFVQTKSSTLRVLGCRMKAATAKSTVRALLSFAGSGDSAPERANDCAIGDSVLQSSNWVLKLIGNGSRIRVQNSLLIAGEDAVVVEPGALAGPLNLQCVFDHDTFAARRAAVRVLDMTAGTLPLDALPLQARGCVFINPFGEFPTRAGLLAFEDQALPHGLVSWQADGNAYDKQLGYWLTTSDSGRETTLPPELCERIWGPLADRRGQIYDGGVRDFKVEQAALDRLNLPAGVRSRIKGTPPGADFEQLGIGKR